MLKVKKILIILWILIFSLNLAGCDKFFQVKRVDVPKAEEKQEIQEIQEEPEKKSEEDRSKEEEQIAEEKKDKEQSELANKEQSEEASTEEEISVPQITEKEELPQEENQETAAASQEGGTLHHLFLTNEFDAKGGMSPLCLKYLVGQDHFIHLLAEYNYHNENPLNINIYWKDYQEDIIYKEEELQEVKADNNNLIKVHSVLGLTKKVAGQDLVPDALGDYWVIIEIDNNIISKTKYSIVGDYQ